MDLVGQRGPAEIAALGTRLAANVTSAVQVPPDAVRAMLIALLAGGHVLIEDYPGVGKTAFARALAASIDADCARVQCTADMLPSDLVGANVYVQRDARFEFRPGPVFSNIVLVDEINRASSKTQSGLLECMQERRVTVDGTTHELAQPFVVIATQNPIEFDGTYTLPQAQLDRFMVRLSLGYPSAEDESAMLAGHADGDRVLALAPVSSVAEVVAVQSALRAVSVTEPLRRYVVALADATRHDPRAQLGASPRAALMLLQAARVQAALHERDRVLPDDVQELAHVVLDHRLLLAAGVPEAGRREIVEDALASVPAL